MIEPTKAEIAMSMLEREILNLLGRFKLADHPLVSLGLDAGKKLYGGKLQKLIESFVGSDRGIDAGAGILKEDLGSCIDNFSRRLKERLNEAEAQNNTNEGAD